MLRKLTENPRVGGSTPSLAILNTTKRGEQHKGSPLFAFQIRIFEQRSSNRPSQVAACAWRQLHQEIREQPHV